MSGIYSLAQNRELIGVRNHEKQRNALDIPAMSENEALARMCASAFAAQLNPTIEEISDIRTAVSESGNKLYNSWL